MEKWAAGTAQSVKQLVTGSTFRASNPNARFSWPIQTVPPLPPTTTTTTMSPVQWVPCLISREWSGQGVAFTTLPLLSPMLRMGRAIPLPSSPPKCPLGTAFAYIYGTWNVTVVATMTNFSVLGEPNPHNHAGLRHSVNQNADLLSSQSGQRSNFRNTKQSDRKFDE